MDFGQLGHLIMQDTLDLFNTGYSVYQDQRNYDFSKDVFDYNKALQNEIFAREDTAYERKRRDLERAGLNPNLAAGGSGSAAGAVVGNSNQAGDHQLSKADLLRNYGAFLDATKAAQEVKQSEYMTSFIKDKSDNLLNDQANQKVIERIEQMYDSGVSPENYWIINSSDRKGRPTMELVRASSPNFITFPGGEWYGDYGIDGHGNIYTVSSLSESKYWKSLQNGWTLENNDVSQSNLDTSMLSTEEEYQTSDKWFNYILKGLNLVFGSGGMAGAYNGARRNNARGHRR